ncbi:hypothetical protein [Nocardia bhagyanarayanae]|uniref:Uncharacterized protein n=1 Tax=Nocardia bhagyanarayanae TaxID=1215925 RepID=A0A543FDH0_9NOCA|nr:hypothetical protein [Nocardia bhagyanarayanae]TQM31908.1 hypothetical protein FB390_3578 [Nocardia bhagyanarayanae]
MRASPAAVRIAVVGIGIHAINHVVVPLLPPTNWNVGTVYHLIAAPVYAALILPLLAGRRWARVVITVLLGCQFAGRFVVWALFPETGARLALIAGWAISATVLALLWIPRPARRHFRASAEQPSAHSSAPLER